MVRNEIRKALQSLPWYMVGGILFFPVVAAPFTAGWSLFLYAGYFRSLQLVMFAAGAGLLLWIFRQFWRAVFFSWKQNHIQHYS